MLTWPKLLERFPNVTPAGAATLMKVPVDRAAKELRARRRWLDIPPDQRIHRKDLRRISAAQCGALAYDVKLASRQYADDLSMTRRDCGFGPDGVFRSQDYELVTIADAQGAPL